MAATTYTLFFGAAAAGGAPTFSTFANADTGSALPPPGCIDVGGGFYTFSVDWSAIGATSIRYAASLSMVVAGSPVSFPDQWDVLTSNPGPGSVTPAVRPQNLALYPTASTVLARAGTQCRLTPTADPYASTDPNWILMRELLVSLGDDLMENGWSHLVQLATFVTDGVSTAWTLPADYHELEDRTLWNRSTLLPGVGPLSFQQAAFLQARMAKVVFGVAYQVAGGQILFPIVPPAGSTCAFYYTSAWWVNSAASGTPDKDRPNANDDVLLFDEELLVTGLKLRYDEASGFDTSRTQERFEAKLEHCLGKESSAPVLNLAGPSGLIDPLVSPEGNLPLTGFGAR